MNKYSIVLADNFVNFARKDIIHAFRTIYPNKNIQIMGSEQAKSYLKKGARIDAIVYFNPLSGFLKMQKCPKILFSGEPTALANRGPCTLVVDCKDVPSLRPRHARFSYYPFYVRSLSERGHNKASQLIKGPNYAENILPKKTKFCAFLFSHDAEPRNQFFHMLSKYKQVDAIGKAPTKFLGPRPPQRKDRGAHDPSKGTYNDGAVSAYTPYKFVIAFENSSHNGYVTEKIINPMFAGAIPIYWGAPDVNKQFNINSFINANDGLQQAINKIKELDQNDELYQKMLMEPWVPNNQLTGYLTDTQNYFTKAIRDSLFSAPVQTSAIRHNPSRSINSRNTQITRRSVAKPKVKPTTRAF